MTSILDGKSLILSNFIAFYYEVMRYKHAATSHQVTEEEKEALSSGKMNLAALISQRLSSVLEFQGLEMGRVGGEYANKYFQEAKYVMAALADEIFLNLKWDGQQDWEDNLLETQIFNTHCAGDQLFANIDQFLLTRDPLAADIAMVYLLALGLGFQGRYRGEADQSEVASYKQRLFLFIYHETPQLLEGIGPLFPQVYMHTGSRLNVKCLPSPRKWHLALLATLAIAIISSIAIWYFTVSDLVEVTNQFLKDFSGEIRE